MNAFKQAIGEHRPQIGFWQALASSYTCEISAGAGFDWLLIDAEHAPNDVPLVLAQLQAASAYPVEPVVRLPVGDPVLIKQYLDIGARSLLIPMIEDAAMATAMVSATRYPPHGIRGVGTAIGRGSRWNRTPGYIRNAAEDICLLLQVESRAAIANVGAIARTEGVDGVFIGPSDLAADLGHLGDAAHPEVQEAIEGAIVAIRAAGKPVGMLMADEALARRYLEIGASFVAVGTDVTILARGAEALAARFAGGDPRPANSGAGGVY
ncbi:MULTISPECIES: 4-hydroxy-2-oxoheptanedioate aldolase [Sphingomonadaceae]|uniref:4-hydroxy-2-oxoheptanedioate aldolase n=1 Tax=Novosphingobium album (ex Liu et al. 2023) TaxID=3031130 RepID=A0ABT5WW26_9SPHN|nr:MULTISPECIES: 4-hydroxy-2-oxoheptanedioate aldolase [Sphingomonadaceae]EZP67604.1 2,4-dihydroxyhept-2-ene-1,7-dioic acid aldolase [Sphingomonas paucimobilis]MDE8654059.1 4-hydroxy-2-oxoheptanedioate aldolase [Novosphingobium album (ex Liu et al. 2023)]